MSKNNGGPAFPVEVSWSESGTTGRQTGNFSGWEMGMSLRDYFAAKALQGIFAVDDIMDAMKSIATQHGLGEAEVFATAAYEYADAMLAAREK